MQEIKEMFERYRNLIVLVSILLIVVIISGLWNIVTSIFSIPFLLCVGGGYWYYKKKIKP